MKLFLPAILLVVLTTVIIVKADDIVSKTPSTVLTSTSQNLKESTTQSTKQSPETTTQTEPATTTQLPSVTTTQLSSVKTTQLPPITTTQSSEIPTKLDSTTIKGSTEPTTKSPVITTKQTTGAVTQQPVQKISVTNLYPIYTHHNGSAVNSSSTQAFSNNPATQQASAKISTPQPGTIKAATTKPVTPKNGGPKATTTATTPPTKRIPPFLREVAALIPELREPIQNMQELNQTQLEMIYNYAKLLERNLKDFPHSLQGNYSAFLKDLKDSGLFDDFEGRTTVPPTGPPPTFKPYTTSWPKCMLDMGLYINGLRNYEQWALEMADATGKPGPSILKGNSFFLGNYMQCSDVSYQNSTSLADIEGNVCRTLITVPIPGVKFGNTDFITPLVWDFCLPKSCQSSDLNRAVKENGVENVIFYCTPELDVTQDPWAMVAIVIVSIIGLLVIAGTLTELCIKSESKRRDNYFIHAYANGNGAINRGFELQEVDGKGNIQGNGSVETGKPVNGEALGNGTSHIMNGDSRTSVSFVNGHEPSTYDHMRYRHTAAEANKKTDVKPEQKKQDDTAFLPSWQKALLAFSLPRNTGKILGVKATPENIGCLHGMRVMSMAWVILGHCILFSGTNMVFQNRVDIFNLFQTLPFQVIINAPLSVDTFFFMSGLLTGYLFLKTSAKTGTVTGKGMSMYYIHRFWRLTPSMMIWIMIVATMIKYVGEGRPGWEDFPGAKPCQDAWWTNLLYINNLYTDKGMCLGVTWFLANDMQFYVLAPLVLIPWVYKQRFIGFLMAGVLIAIHLSSNIWLILDGNFDIMRNSEEYSDKLYFKPYARVAPFAIGLIFGYILYRTKCKIHMNKFVVTIGWALAFAVTLTITLVTYDENKDAESLAVGWSAAGKAAFETASRPLWALICGWVVLACATGYGGFVNSILSWEGFLPLSRLTYGAFLVHVTVMNYMMVNAETTTLFTMTTMVYQFIGYYVISYAVAFLLAVSVEAPMLGLEKLVFSK